MDKNLSLCTALSRNTPARIWYWLEQASLVNEVSHSKNLSGCVNVNPEELPPSPTDNLPTSMRASHLSYIWSRYRTQPSSPVIPFHCFSNTDEVFLMQYTADGYRRTLLHQHKILSVRRLPDFRYKNLKCRRSFWPTQCLAAPAVVPYSVTCLKIAQRSIPFFFPFPRHCFPQMHLRLWIAQKVTTEYKRSGLPCSTLIQRWHGSGRPTKRHSCDLRVPCLVVTEI